MNILLRLCLCILYKDSVKSIVYMPVLYLVPIRSLRVASDSIRVVVTIVKRARD